MTDGTVERQGLAARLGAFVHDLDFNNLPAEVVEAAKGRILDTLSCCLAGRDLPPSRIAADMSRSVAGECAVIGYERRTGMLEAALANGTMAHSTSQDDVISGIAHGGSAVVPAALAVGEQKRASGAEVIAAVVAGYEMVWRILKAVGRVAHPAFRPGTIFTALGAAAAASRLMGLDAERTGHALGYAASLTPGTPNEGWWGGTMEPIIEIGMTARIGLLAAQFARAGGTAAPLVFEGPHGFLNCWAGRNDRVEQALDGLGRDFAVTRTYIKPFAACGANQVPIQVARTLASHGLGAEDIERIVEKLRPGAKDYAGLDHAGPFTSHVQALMSMQFCAAAAVLGRNMGTPDFISGSFDDPEVERVAAQVELVEEEGRTVPAFEVHTRDGRVLAAEEEKPDRSIHVPTTESMMAKFHRLAEGRLEPARADEIVGLVMGLERLAEPGRLTEKLVWPPR